MFLKMWIFGPLLQKVAVARFTRTLGTMIASGVPILDGLEIVARTAGNVVIEEALMDVRSAISEGKTIAEPLQESGVFPGMVVQMIAVGEETGAMESMLSKIADFYDEEVDAAVEALTSHARAADDGLPRRHGRRPADRDVPADLQDRGDGRLSAGVTPKAVAAGSGGGRARRSRRARIERQILILMAARLALASGEPRARARARVASAATCTSSEWHGFYGAVVVAFLATLFYWPLQGRVRDLRRFAAVNIATDIALVSALVLFSGGGESVFTFLYVAVIAYAALLLRARRRDRVGRWRRPPPTAPCCSPTTRASASGTARRALGPAAGALGAARRRAAAGRRRWRRSWSPSSSAPAPRSRSAPATWCSCRRCTSARSRA